MVKAKAVGYLVCHVCGFVESEVKISLKSGMAFTFCPECNVQSFARAPFQHDNLLKKMRPVDECQSIPVADIAVLEAALLPKKGIFSLDDL